MCMIILLRQKNVLVKLISYKSKFVKYRIHHANADKLITR